MKNFLIFYYFRNNLSKFCNHWIIQIKITKKDLIFEYYSIINKKDEYFINSINNKIYNDNIFYLNKSQSILDLDDLLNLKNIYYQNYYQYKHFNLPIRLKKFTNCQNNKLSKNIYQKFNMFISGDDIYGILDNPFTGVGAASAPAY